MDLVALRIAGRRLSSAGLCFRLPCGRLAFVKKDGLRSSSKSARMICWFECHVTYIEGSIEHALVWHCFMKLSLRTEPSELKRHCCSLVDDCLRHYQVVGEAAAVSPVRNARNG